MVTTTARPGVRLQKTLATVVAPTLLSVPALALEPAGSGGTADHQAPPCDSALKHAFDSDPQTTLILAHQFRRGDKLALSDRELSPLERMMAPAESPRDICLVKLVVGPGNPGPAGAPSTSEGIGIEIWLPQPEDWNRRLHALGGGGFDGGAHTSSDQIGELRAAGVALQEGAITVHSDGGHSRSGGVPGQESGGGDWAMNPDGSLNTLLLKDFASRTMHEMAAKSKQLAAFYYGRQPDYAYWEGSSNGGRQAFMIAQMYPDDYDGIIGSMPAINWSEFMLYDLYPQVLFQQDLGGEPLSEAQQDLVSNAAITACDLVDGQHMGYILDMAACRYDPTRDTAVLCVGDGGSNATPDCVTKKQARVVNKIWYGLTADGSVPLPARDNGWDSGLSKERRWYGLPRGTSLYNAMFSRLFNTNAGIANVSGAFSHATDTLALVLEDPAMASGNFRNASGDGQDGWKALSYAQLADAIDRAKALQAKLGHVDSNNPDLSAFRASGGKLLSWHGMHDEVIPVQGSLHYYDRVVQTMGGVDKVSDFFKLYVVPGVGHATPNGTSNPMATPPGVDMAEFYQLLVDWVENGIEPGTIELRTPAHVPAARTYLACAYPATTDYVDGDPFQSSSYRCTDTD